MVDQDTSVNWGLSGWNLNAVPGTLFSSVTSTTGSFNATVDVTSTGTVGFFSVLGYAEFQTEDGDNIGRFDGRVILQVIGQ